MTLEQHDQGRNEGGVWATANHNVFTGPGGFQNNAPISQLNQYITEAEGKEAQYLRDLYITDPRYDKQRLEEAKGGILPAACEWILSQAAWQTWRYDTDARLLWIKGGPGTGKTMLFGYIIDQVVSGMGEDDEIAYFFCEEGNRETSSASAVLRGLCYMLITRSKTPDKRLLDIVGEVSDGAGAKAFDGPGAWYRLEKMFRMILRSLGTKRIGGTIFLLVDALNECSENLQNLLRLVVDLTGSEDAPRGIKWLLTSQRGSSISRKLNIGGTGTRSGMDLDDYSEHRLKALDSFVDHCTKRLTSLQNGLDFEEVRNQLRGKIGRDNSFLYTALLAASAQRARGGKEVTEILENAAEGIAGLYEQTIDRINHLEDDIRRECLEVLGVVATAYRSLHHSELHALTSIESDETGRRVIQECDAFFVVNNNGDAQIVNQSARDFLNQSALIPSMDERHRRLFSKSLKTMERLLGRDVCQLVHPGYATVDIKPEQLAQLEGVGYACEYWIEHLLAFKCGNLEPKDAEAVGRVLKNKFLNWVEVMSVLGNGRQAVLPWSKLVKFLQGAPHTERLIEIATDQQRFLESNAEAIMAYPLQVYASALVFAPTNSQTKELFADQEPSWVSLGSGMERTHWNPWTRILNPETSGVVVVKPACFSSDGTWVAALLERADETRGHPYSEVAIWDLATSVCLWTLPGATDCVGFPHWKRWVAIVMGGNVDFWDLQQGCWDTSKRIEALNPTCAAFSPDGVWLAAVTGEFDNEVEMWDWERRDRVLKFGRTGNHGASSINSVAFSPSGFWLATADTKGVSVWNHESGDCLWSIDTFVTSVGFTKSPDNFVVLAGYDALTVFNWREKSPVRKLVVSETQSLRETRNPVAVSADGSRLAVARASNIKVWDAATRRRLYTLSGYDKYVCSLAFSPDGDQLASGGDWGLKICPTMSTRASENRDEKDHIGRIKWIKASDDRKKIISISVDAVLVWDAKTGRRLSKIEPEVKCEDDILLDASLSGDGSYIILVHRYCDPTVWDLNTGRILQSIDLPSVLACCISPDGARAALITLERTIRIWNLASRRFDRGCLNLPSPECATFSPTSDRIAVSSGGEVTVWELKGRRQTLNQAMEGFEARRSLCFSSDGLHLVGSSAREDEIAIWDVSSGHRVELVGGLLPGIDVIGFDTTRSRVLTNYGLFITNEQADGSEAPQRDTAAGKIPGSMRQGFGIDESMSWITSDSDRVLWLPPEYRPDSMMVLPPQPSQKMQASLIAIGCRSGKVVFLRFSGGAPQLAPTTANMHV